MSGKPGEAHNICGDQVLLTSDRTFDSELDEPIFGRSIGGLCLGDPEDLVLERLGVPTRRQARDDPEAQLLDYPSMLVRLSGTRRVEMVMALSGYRGSGPYGVRVGMPWMDLRARDVPIWFEEDSMSWRLQGISDIYIELIEGADGSDEPNEVFHEVASPMDTYVGSIFVSE